MGRAFWMALKPVRSDRGVKATEGRCVCRRGEGRTQVRSKRSAFGDDLIVTQRAAGSLSCLTAAGRGGRDEKVLVEDLSSLCVAGLWAGTALPERGQGTAAAGAAAGAGVALRAPSMEESSSLDWARQWSSRLSCMTTIETQDPPALSNCPRAVSKSMLKGTAVNCAAESGAVLFYGLAALLVFAPLYWGGNRPLPLLVMELAALALLVGLVGEGETSSTFGAVLANAGFSHRALLLPLIVVASCRWRFGPICLDGSSMPERCV